MLAIYETNLTLLSGQPSAFSRRRCETNPIQPVAALRAPLQPILRNEPNWGALCCRKLEKTNPIRKPPSILTNKPNSAVDQSVSGGTFTLNFELLPAFSATAVNCKLLTACVQLGAHACELVGSECHLRRFWKKRQVQLISYAKMQRIAWLSPLIDPSLPHPPFMTTTARGSGQD